MLTRHDERMMLDAWREWAKSPNPGTRADLAKKFVPRLCDMVEELRLALDIERGMADDRLPVGWQREPDAEDMVVLYRRDTPAGGCAFAWTKHNNLLVTSGFIIWATPEPLGIPLHVDRLLPNCLSAMQECDNELHRD